MLPLVSAAIYSCLVTPVSFEGVPDRLAEIGFVEVGKNGKGDTRWIGSEGIEAFLSHSEHQLICSVWFDGDYQKSAEEFSLWLTDLKFDSSVEQDDMGVIWHPKDDRAVRLVSKQDSNDRLGLAVFVNRN